MFIKGFSISTISGRNSFFIKSGNSQRKKIDNSLFFNAYHNQDKLKLKLEYDDEHKEDNGIINLKLEYDEKIKYGFYYEKNIFFYNNSRYHGLSYEDNDTNIIGGWYTGQRTYESLTLGDKRNIFLKNTDLIENTETITVNGRKIEKNIDYYIDYPSGIINLLPLFPYKSIIKISYSYNDPSNKNKSYFSLNKQFNDFNYSIIENINTASLKKDNIEFKYWFNKEENSIYGSGLKYVNNDLIIKYNKDNKDNNNNFTGILPEWSLNTKTFNIDVFDTYECYYVKLDPLIDIGLLSSDNNSFYTNIHGPKNRFYFDSHLLKENNKGLSTESYFSFKIKKNLRFFQKDFYKEGKPFDRERNLVFFNTDLIINGSYINGTSSLKMTQKKGRIKKAITLLSNKKPIMEISYRDNRYSSIITYDDSIFIRSSVSMDDIILSYEKRQNQKDLYRFDIRNIYFRMTFSYSEKIEESTSIDIPVNENTINLEYDAIQNTGKYSYVVNIR
ncbi:MAG: hypothetical protein C0601_04850 [Candidatus Muiribacterium halophilum]|uniref:Uncharacterized protein n=1 Tax=Muiribacterium halophilum TaxID=2053465 RepID=A0A2N5ZI47_MUIH1|nr:MAG: hypothetical protein C0601_04850 [Candidatus Muirbacterium halophilum]